MSWVTFERLACGLSTRRCALRPMKCRWKGDADLGRRVVAEMNYMF